ncbi:DUF2283 domain-containing protein [Selenihalanaerobacter shriftii]|uniref:DUF2283 domain-containing protein n=1 Tax=Selenihalanaerobacter shriftii TaxID=142842 RepID=A0A1T4JSB9_9FIRM|nr:DUF2283 domain-containing protein [Selenihalanaerobacter shriftii]SJZ33004.1 Protein of unknown function [Selenihalanaerobacter shriftii]
MMEIEFKVKVTYDQEADLGYIYLAEICEGEVEYSIKVEDKVLDFDGEGRLLGIEFLDGKAGLPKSLISKLEGEK